MGIRRTWSWFIRFIPTRERARSSDLRLACQGVSPLKKVTLLRDFDYLALAAEARQYLNEAVQEDIARHEKEKTRS
jgi:hypothetical protein